MLWPIVLNPFIRSLDRLGHQLGIDHDLAELEAAIKENNIIRGKPLEKVLNMVAQQRKRIQRSAWKLALKIYAEKPSSFSRRMEAYWKVEKTNINSLLNS